MTIYNRALQQIGNSILVSLPSEWIKKNLLTKGKVISMETNSDNTISIYNINQEQEIKIEFNYHYDDRELSQKMRLMARARTTRFQA